MGLSRAVFEQLVVAGRYAGCVESALVADPAARIAGVLGAQPPFGVPAAVHAGGMLGAASASRRQGRKPLGGLLAVVVEGGFSSHRLAIGGGRHPLRPPLVPPQRRGQTQHPRCAVREGADGDLRSRPGEVGTRHLRRMARMAMEEKARRKIRSDRRLRFAGPGAGPPGGATPSREKRPQGGAIGHCHRSCSGTNQPSSMLCRRSQKVDSGSTRSTVSLSSSIVSHSRLRVMGAKRTW